MLKKGPSSYHYIELMACPMGCLNGGGQLPVPNTRIEVPIMMQALRRSEDWLRLESAAEMRSEDLQTGHNVVERPMSLRW
jgi:iron only hydrogenase large subunit-like protein